MKISDAKDWFKRRETRIQRTYEDSVGEYGFRVSPDELGESFDVSAVSQSHDDGDVSVMEKLAKRANEQDRYLILFVGSPPPLVYDPAEFLSRGTEYVINDDRKKRGERWLKIPKDSGVSLEEYADGHKDPGQNHGDLSDWGAGQ